MQHRERFLGLIESNCSNVPELTVDELVQLQAGESKPTIIDVREDSEWDMGHMKGALHLGKGVIECYIETQVPDLNTPLVLYCRGGFRSLLAAATLQQMGYHHVSSLKGGLSGWVEAGQPIDGELKKPS